MTCGGGGSWPTDRRTRVLYGNPLFIAFLLGTAVFDEVPEPLSPPIVVGLAAGLAVELAWEHLVIAGEQLRGAFCGA